MADSDPKTKGQKEEKKEKDAIEKYNVGTLKMYISPEIIETNKSGDFKKRKLSKIYYLRKYTETPSELQQSQKIQAAAAAPAPAPAPAPAAGPVAAAAAPPVIAPPIAAPPLNQNLVPKVGGLFSTSSLDSDNSPTAVNRPSGSSSYSPSSTGYSNESIANKPTYDAEPFISSLIKFTNAGFPSNSTVKSRVDTFFNIKAFRAYLKKLGEPITLFDKNNKTKNPSDIKILGSGSNEPGSGVDGKKIIEDKDGNKLQTKPQNYEALIGSVYAFLFTNPSEQEKRQQSESSKTKTLKPSLLMVKDGDEYSLLGSKIDNQEKQLTALGASVVTNQLSKITSDNKINKTIEEAFTKKTGTTFPGTSSDTRRTLVFEPKPMDTAPTIDTKIDNLAAIINSGQVDLSKMNSIIQSSKNRTSFGSGDLVLVPIIDIYNVVKGNVSASQIEGKISISPRQQIMLKLTIELLQKQNILPTLTGEERQKDTFHTDKERMEGLADLSPATISELNSTVIHNIKFILNVIFSNKTTFLNGGTSYIIDYVDWNNTFKQLKDTAIQKNMKVGYYIEIELFIEKFDKGKLPINRADSFLGSCTVKRARLNSSWKRDFLNQNWGQVVKNFKDAFKPDPNASIASAIAGIIPNSIRKTLLGSSRDLMPRLNAGVNQISFVQYTFLGQDELIKAFKLVDNSYAGVAWKNNQAWEKRKERLFGAVDSCDADVYCFQNVQCSINVYKNIVKKLSTAKQDALKSTDTSPQTLRMNIYKNDIHEQLLSDTTDPTNLVAQIYEKYKDYYHFVYFFEQKCIIPTQIPSPTSTIRTCILEPDTEFPDIAHPTAVGNLTMIKKLKFEIKEIFDIRMAPVLFLKGAGKDGLLKDEPFKPLWNNDKSFASITYCSFIGKGASIVASPGGISMGTTGVISKPKLPGIQNFEVKDVDGVQDTDSKELKNADIEDDNKDDNGEDISESQIKQIKDEIKEDEKDDEESGDVEGEGEGVGSKEAMPGQAGGNNQEWYEKDDTEEKAYGVISGKKPDNIEETKPVICEKYFDVKYIPIGQIFGIINVTLDAENTAKAAAEAAVAATGKLPTGKKSPTTTPTTDDNKPLSKEAIEVLLIAALIYRFRLRYLLAGSTDNIPVFLSGDFNFDNNKSDPLAKQLLEIRSREFKKKFIPAAELNFKPYGNIITEFIYKCNILDYLYGGILRTGRFKSTVITPSKILEGVTFPLSRSDDRESFNKKRENQLIFKTRRLVFCPDEIIDGMEPMDHNNNFPDFPDNINPSNSNAIGGIFNIETQAVKQHISTVNSELKLKKQVQNNEDIKDLLGNMGEADEDDDGDHEDDHDDDGEDDDDGDGDGDDGDEGDKEDFSNTESSDGKPEKIIPAVIKNMKDTTYSKQKSFFKSPYPKFVDICQSGNTEYNYLTTIPMNQWKNGANQFSVYSDHAPVKFSIYSDIDPSNGKHSCGKALGGGAQVGGGLEEMEGMEGGGVKDINLISWNIANICFKKEGSPGKPGYQSHKFVCDPAKIDCEETPDQYNIRLTNIASALEKLMSNNYKYTLIQEGPFFSKDAITKSHITTFINSINSRKSITVHQANIQSAGNTYYSQFYIVTRKDDKDVYDSMGLIALGNSGKKLFSGFCENILKDISSTIHIDNYLKEDIAADFSKIWFFINQTQKIILIPVHLPLPQTGSPIKFISQRQQQIYSFMNAIVMTIRRSSDSKITQYKDYDIVFSGDFNINMIQKFPSDMIPTFLKCSAVSGQETIIYTNKDNAPSSFGGDNKGEFNPTNIDFAVYYPKVTLKATTKPAKPAKPTITTKPGKPGKPTGPSSSSSSKIPTVLSTDKIEALSASKVASVTSAIAKVNEIPYRVEQEIFKSNPDPIKAAMLKNNVSIIGTDYNKLYLNIGGGAGIMPPGSASLINISGAPIYDIQYDVVNSTSTTLPAGSISSCVNFMIQASPAQSGSGGLITRDTVANSIMNSLILAAQNGAKNVIIPFIGGGVFLGELQRKLGSGYSLAEHAKILVKGATRYFEFVSTPEAALLKINAKSIETILFCPFNSPKVDEKTPLDDAIKAKNFVFTGKCNVITTNGSMNIIKATIAQCNSGMKNIAIVNAANVELEFGTGIASMCYAAINKDKSKQAELRDIRKQFVIAYKNYTSGKKASPGPSPVPSPPSSPSKLPGPPGPMSPVKLPGSSPPASPSKPSGKLPGLPAASPPVSPSKPPGKLPGLPAASPAPSPPASPSKPPGKLTFGPRATVLNFLNAQAGKKDFPDNSMPPFSYTAALNEIKAGKKKEHWIWYIIPSDIHKGSKPTSVFYGIGPNADIRAKRDGVKVLSAEEYLNEPTLRQRYIEILTLIGKSVYDKFGKYSGLKDTRPQDFLINLMGGRTDYDKLTSSFRNLYYIIARKPHSDYLGNLHDILDGFYRKENGITSDIRPISPIAAPIAAPIVAPLPAPIVPKVTTVGARIVSLQQITDRIISASKSKPGSIFLINGGSFNPPHIGHIKTFELAYQQLMRMDAFKGQSVYGIMVVSTDKHIVGKNVPKDAIISPENRIQLCQLAADSYAWKNPASFGQNNMLIYNTADDHPAGTIIYHIQGIDKKINNMYYLSGSDFYINTYLRSKSGSPYNIMYVMRKEDITKSIQPRKNGKTQIPIVPKDKSGVAFDLSSSVIRQQINSLVDESNRKIFQRDIYNEVGRGVYCRLQQMNYIQPGKLYGDLCIDKGVGMMGETGKRTSGLLSTSPPSSPPSSPQRRPQVIVSGDLLNRLSHGLLSERDIPENERPGLDLRLRRTFDNIDNVRVFNVGMNEGQIRAALVNLVNKIPDPTHNVANYVPFVTAAIQARDIRFFNDLYYFFNTLQDMDPASARRRRDNTRHLYNCLNDLRFISMREFNDDYLRASGQMNQMYLSKLNESSASIARLPNPDIRFKVLNYLLFTGRYSVYLYLLGITSKNDNSFHGLGCGETLFNEYKLYVESQEGIGYQRILDIIRYRFMRARGNGNCYYNSIGMLTASPDVLRGYEGMSLDQKEAVQQQQQTRVRTQLAEFMRAIYTHIGGSRFDINQYERNARSRGAGVNFQSGINNIRFLLYAGRENFRPISEIDIGVSPEFHGGETEMAFTSLFYQRPILTVSMNLPNGDQAGGFDARYFERYAPPGYNSLSRFMTTPGVTANQVVDFIVNQGVISVLSLEQGSQMIIAGNSMIPPQAAMILVGGQGHWNYAIPSPGLGASIPRSGVGLGASLRSSAKRGGQTSNITKKNKSSISISVNKKTRKTTKTTTRNNNSPKNNNKKKTQHFKIVRNGNNTRKKAK